MAELHKMSTEQLTDFFSNYVKKSSAVDIAAGFESAIVSEEANALKTWAKNTFSITKKNPRKDIISKIDALTERGIKNPEGRANLIQSLLAEKIGVTISEEEANTIGKMSTELQTEFDKPFDEYGNPQPSYFAKRKALEKYLQSIQPVSKLKVATSLIGRGSLVAAPKSIITNIVGNTSQGIQQSFERRIASNQYVGKADKAVVKGYLEKASKIYKDSGFDVSRMYEYSEGRKVLGEHLTHAGGKGLTRKIGRLYEDVVFRKLLSAPDAYFARVNFADSANLLATKIAKQEGLKGKELSTRATELFKEATAVGAKGMGSFIREQAIADANLATFQNESTYANIGMALRGVFNQATGDARLGDLIMPFVKTPANVIGMSIDSSVFGALNNLYKLPKAQVAMKAGNPKPMRDVMRGLVRAGLGQVAAYLFSALLDPEDFLGFWPSSKKEQELVKLKGASSNSIKVGDRWVSLDYFGFMGGPMIGMLYAKKYGDSLPNMMYNYAIGAGKEQLLQIPGLEETQEMIADIQALKPGDESGAEDIKEGVVISVLDFIRSRSVPGIVTDIAKALDSSEREVDWKNPLQKLQASTPGWRSQLPEKVDVFGEVIKTEPSWSVMLFGSRMKGARDSRLTDELSRLDDAGFLPSITRPERTSPRFKALKVQIGDEKFSEAMGYFRNEYKTRVSNLMGSSKYQRSDDEEKSSEWNGVKTRAMDRTLKRYGYRKPK